MGASASMSVAEDYELEETPNEQLLRMDQMKDLPGDGSDMVDLETAQNEVVRLRRLIGQINASIAVDKTNREDLLSTKLQHQSFRGGSLNQMLSQAVEFVDRLLTEGYENIPPNGRYAGFRNLRSFLKSPALTVMLARKNVQEDLRKRVESTDDQDMNDYIIGHYASSDSIHDVSMVRERAKTKFGNAMMKLKGNLMLAALLGGKKQKEERRKRTSSFIASSPHLTHLKVTDAEKRDLDNVLTKMGDFDFDVWDLVPLTGNQPLMVCGMELFKRWEIDTRLGIKDEMTLKFFMALEKGYMANPYHNSVHGADVMFTVNSFIQASERMHDCMEPMDLFAALVAGAAHDYKHDGVNNAFHVNTGSDLALRYNDQSVLESMHSAELFLLCRDETVNVFSGLEPGAFKEVRRIITGAILGTDMTKHFNHIADFESRLAAEKQLEADPDAMEEAGPEQRLDKRIMIEMALHCADISNPAKDLTIYRKWVVVVMDEFYAQGDKERDLGMPISPMFDRNNSSVKKTQVGFIQFIIEPIYRVWGDFIPELAETFAKNLEIGKAFGWDEYYVEAKQTAADNAIAEGKEEEEEEGRGEGGAKEEEKPPEKAPTMLESASAPRFEGQSLDPPPEKEAAVEA